MSSDHVRADAKTARAGRKLHTSGPEPSVFSSLQANASTVCGLEIEDIAKDVLNDIITLDVHLGQLGVGPALQPLYFFNARLT